MKCQHCHEREAVNSFLVAYPGGQQEVHLCEECTKLAQKHYYEAAKRVDAISQRKVGNIPFPQDAGQDVRRRRQMNMLHARLEKAVNLERFEEAARLRDEIAAAEKDVLVQ